MAKKKQIVSGNIYGPHEFDDSKKGRSYCKFGCGCYWSRHGKKGGPIGLHPFLSPCPNNLIKGEKLPGDQDYRNVVEGRIQDLIDGIYRGAKIEARLFGLVYVFHSELLKLGVTDKKIDRLKKSSKPM